MIPGSFSARETTTKNYNNFVFATQRPHDVLRETTTKKNYNPQGAGRLLYDLERETMTKNTTSFVTCHTSGSF